MAIFSALAGAIAQGGSQAGGDMAYGAASQAAQMNQQEAGRARQAASPWNSTGIGALTKVAGLLGLGELRMSDQSNPNSFWGIYGDGKAAQDKELAAFQTTPGYQFRVDEGVKALDRSAASRGLLRSGAQAKGITDFGQNIASDEYGNYFNNLLKVAGMGSESTAAVNNTSAGLVSSGGNMLTQGGIARGSAYAAGANALASGIGAGVNNAIGGAYLFRNSLGGGSGTGNSLGGRLASYQG